MIVIIVVVVVVVVVVIIVIIIIIIIMTVKMPYGFLSSQPGASNITQAALRLTNL